MSSSTLKDIKKRVQLFVADQAASATPFLGPPDGMASTHYMPNLFRRVAPLVWCVGVDNCHGVGLLHRTCRNTESERRGTHIRSAHGGRCHSITGAAAWPPHHGVVLGSLGPSFGVQWKLLTPIPSFLVSSTLTGSESGVQQTEKLPSVGSAGVPGGTTHGRQSIDYALCFRYARSV
jgi:hypothetical protein